MARGLQERELWTNGAVGSARRVEGRDVEEETEAVEGGGSESTDGVRGKDDGEETGDERKEARSGAGEGEEEWCALRSPAWLL